MTFHCLTTIEKSVSLKYGNSRTNITLCSFPERYKWYLIHTRCGSTIYVEYIGSKIASKNHNPSHAEIYEFVRLVYWWGVPAIALSNLEHLNGGKKKAESNVAKAVIAAISHLHEPKPNLKSALDALRTVRGLGEISISSKILRMLMPEKAVVLDKILQGFLKKGKLTSSDYADWCEDCVRMAKKIPKKNYMRQDKVWKAADVESVIYHEVSGNRKKYKVQI